MTGAYATGKTIAIFRDRVSSQLKKKTLPGKKKPLYFVPVELMTATAKDSYAGKLGEVDVDDLSEEVEDILGDISGSSVVVDLEKAKLDETIARTKVLNQRLSETKELMFDEWSSKFFDVFSRNFTKFKNELVQLHLDQEKTDNLQKLLSECINNLGESLDDIKNEYLNNEEEL